MTMDKNNLRSVMLNNYLGQPAVTAWENGIIDYFKGATGITQASVENERANVNSALQPMLGSSAGEDAIQSAFDVVWNAMVAAPPAFFVGAVAVTRSGTGIAAAMLAVFPINKSLPVDPPSVRPTSKATGATNMSDAMHAANLGGEWEDSGGGFHPIV